MRPVKVFTSKWDYEKRVFEKIFIGIGWFHQWGIDSDPDGDNMQTYSVAIVEMQDGKVLSVLPDNIQFNDKK